jgi:hypothetical protein
MRQRLLLHNCKDDTEIEPVSDILYSNTTMRNYAELCGIQ